MSIPTRLRISGWIVSLAGGGLYVFSGGLGGGFGAETRWLPMVGAVVMVLGIIITSTSPLVATLQARRQINEQLARYKDAPPGTPAPPK